MTASPQHPRKQAQRLVELVSREGSGFRAALLAKRGEGKTNLLRQVHRRLFEQPEGPIPFLYEFQKGRDEAGRARHFFASFCQQVRAFLMRQEDLLWEPVAHLESELERPGLPLALTELGRNVQAAPAGYGTEVAAGLPAQFAHLERRPVCLLLDEAQTLDRESPFFAALRSQNICRLLTGRSPFVSRLAGESSWPVLRVDALSVEEALGLAEKRCEASGLEFLREPWEKWFGLAGTSCRVLESLVDGAAAENEPVDSIERLGRVYVGSLAGGSLGDWLTARWEAAVTNRRDRARTAEFLAALANAGFQASAASLSAELWDGLVAEEWAEETPLGPLPTLHRVERDWLEFVTACATASPERAEARSLHRFLVRTERMPPRTVAAEALSIIGERLRLLPESGFPESWEWEAQGSWPPRIHSVASERAGTAELFWLYGFREEREETIACVLLVVLCEEAPSSAQRRRWQQQLQEEARRLSGGAPGREPPSSYSALWLVLPADATLVPEGAERRFTWNELLRLLASD